MTSLDAKSHQISPVKDCQSTTHKRQNWFADG